MRNALCVLLLTTAVVGFARTVSAAPTYTVTFDSATGSADGSSISGVTGGTATIRDNGDPGTSQVVNTAPDMGAGGYLRTTLPSGGVVNQGALFAPASPANSLGAMFSKPGSQDLLNGAIDFFFRSDTAIDVTNELRVLDADNTGSGGLRLRLRNRNTTNDLSLQIGVSGDIAFGTVDANSAFQITAGNIYHLGFTLATDPGTGLTTAKLFGLQGTGPIDTSANTLAGGFLGSTTFNLDEVVVTTGFPTGAYPFGVQDAAGAPKIQDFDNYRLYDANPGVFNAVPEPSTLALLGTGLAFLVAIYRRRKD